MGFRILARRGRRALLTTLSGVLLAQALGLVVLLTLAPPGA